MVIYFITVFFWISYFLLLPLNGQSVLPQKEQTSSGDFILNLDDLNAISTVVLLIDPVTGTILKANKAAQSFYEYADLEGMNIHEINTLPTKDISEEMTNALNQKRNYFNFKHRTSSGKIKLVRVHSYPISYKGRKVLLSIIHDVTEEEKKEYLVFNLFLIIISAFLVVIIFYLMRAIVERKKTEKNLISIQNSLELAQEIGNIGSWEYDIQNRTSRWSKNYYNMLGIRYSAVTPTHALFLQTLHSEDLYLYKYAEEEAIRNRKPQIVELRYYSADQSIRWCRIHIASFYKGDELVSLQGVVIDITDEKVFELKFRSQLSYTSFAFQAARKFINITSDDFSGLIRTNLLEMCETFNVDIASFVKFRSRNDELDIMEMAVRKNLTRVPKSILATHLDSFPELYRRSQEGDYFLVQDVDCMDEVYAAEKKEFLRIGIQSFLGLPIVHQAEILGYLTLECIKQKNAFDNDKIVSLQLIAELYAGVIVRRRIFVNLVRATEAANLANRSKSAFLSKMSHELRTPLNGVIGFTDLLLDTPLNEMQKEYLKHISISARNLLEIISNLLNLSKIESGKMELEETVIDLHELMRESLAIVQYQIRSKGISSQLIIGSDVPRFASLDSDKIRQVILNLLSNAVKNTQEGGIDLTVSFQKDSEVEGTFHFSVKDTGSGISPSQKLDLQQSLARENSSLIRNLGETGLGLTVANAILKLYHSGLNFKSEPGKGTEFYFSIRAKYYSETTIHSHTADSKEDPKWGTENLGFQGLSSRILLAEDLEMNRILVKNMIQKIIPHSVILEAENGEKAVEIFQKEKPDLVFMDVQMPIMNGLEATEWIRNLEKEISWKPNTPIIALTAGATQEELRKAIEYGMNETLTKPILKKDLTAILEKYLLDPKHGKKELA